MVTDLAGKGRGDAEYAVVSLLLTRRGLIGGAGLLVGAAPPTLAGCAGPPDAPVVYPRGVKAAGLEAVWDLRTTAGLSHKLSRATAKGAVPPGWARDSGPGLFYSPNTPHDLRGWSFNNGQILTRNVGTYTDCYFNNPGSTVSNSKLAGLGELAVGAATFTHCSFDGTGMRYYVPPKMGASAMVTAQTGCPSTFRGCRFDNAPLVNLKSFCETLVVEDCFFGTFGHDPAPESHMESIFIDAGQVSFDRVCMDPSGYQTGRGITGTLNIEAKSFDISMTLNDCVLTGSDALKLLFPCQIGGKMGKRAHLTISGCAIQRGSSGYFGVTEVSGGSVIIFDGGGNRDLNSGALINVSFPSSKRRVDS